MTTPFWCLLVAVLFPYVWAGVGAYYKKQQFGAIDSNHPRAQSAALTDAGARANAAQLNSWEALPVFGAAVIVAHLAGANPGLSATASLVFVASRALHGLFYISNLAPLRSLAFTVGFGSCLWLFGLAARA
ncbi:MAG: MAPEG family protein [Myxococcota bacterium]